MQERRRAITRHQPNNGGKVNRTLCVMGRPLDDHSSRPKFPSTRSSTRLEDLVERADQHSGNPTGLSPSSVGNSHTSSIMCRSLRDHSIISNFPLTISLTTLEGGSTKLTKPDPPPSVRERDRERERERERERDRERERVSKPGPQFDESTRLNK